MDIINMSLGGTHGKSGNAGFADLLMNAVNDLDQAGMISAIAAGNSGPGFNTVESPGAAARALTAGAMTVGHFIGGQRHRRRHQLRGWRSASSVHAAAVSWDALASSPSDGCSALQRARRRDRADPARDVLVLGQDPQRAERGGGGRRHS